MFVSSISNQQSFSMQVRDTTSTSGDAWRKVFGKEAAAVNPLAAVNHGRNSLILESIRTNDWSNYHDFQAKQQPAWYDKVNGEFKQNKMYYSNLIDVQNRSLKEAIQSGDETEIANRKAHLNELISDFKKAPGEVPHVIAFITDPALAAEHGIGKPSSDWYNSPYNNPLVASQGRFEEQNWYDNPYFIDNPKELTFAMESVKEFRPEIAKIAAQINKGAYERNAASTSFIARATQAIAGAAVKEEEKNLISPSTEQVKLASSIETAQQTEQPVVNKAILMQAEQIIQQFSTSTIIEQLFKQKEQLDMKTAQDYLLDRLAKNAGQQKYQEV
ncbi:hypothetical protein [Sporosarcina sp. E16_8]|uniref:hypothetical protein n=1 Tax=Sporosarcina sp. E16_8 TaxID=2789295 RepID=UPI001A9169DE|nr:hypothetical protein [Sporosarcina sp. E16_8]MBO0589412.1 hypothetical protein [Sporosarcina sp. E16_8]